MVDFKRGVRKWNIDRWAACGAFRTCEVNWAPERFDPVFVAEMQLTGDAITGTTYTAEDASYAKLREIAATWTVPDHLARRIGASRASATVAGRNLHIWTKWSGYDPEDMVIRDLVGHLYKSQNHLPQLAQFLTTINLSF
jgi:hypothetical protein